MAANTGSGPTAPTVERSGQVPVVEKDSADGEAGSREGGGQQQGEQPVAERGQEAAAAARPAPPAIRPALRGPDRQGGTSGAGAPQKGARSLFGLGRRATKTAQGIAGPEEGGASQPGPAQNEVRATAPTGPEPAIPVSTSAAGMRGGGAPAAGEPSRLAADDVWGDTVSREALRRLSGGGDERDEKAAPGPQSGPVKAPSDSLSPDSVSPGMASPGVASPGGVSSGARGGTRLPMIGHGSAPVPAAPAEGGVAEQEGAVGPQKAVEPAPPMARPQTDSGTTDRSQSRPIADPGPLSTAQPPRVPEGPAPERIEGPSRGDGAMGAGPDAVKAPPPRPRREPAMSRSRPAPATAVLATGDPEEGSRRAAMAEVAAGHGRLRAVLVALGLLLTAGWLTVAAYYVETSVGWENLPVLLPHEIGAFLAGAFAPLAFLWMFLAVLINGRAAAARGRALLDLAARLDLPTPEAERRVVRMFEAVEEQGQRMQDLSERIGAEVEALHAVVDSGGETLGEASATLLREMETTRRQVAEKAEGSRRLVGDIAAQNAKLAELSALQGTELRSAAEAARNAAEAVSAELDRKLKALDGALSRSQQAFRSIGGAIEISAGDLEGAADKAVGFVRQASSAMATEARAIGEASDASVRRVEQAVAAIKRYKDDADGMGAALLARLRQTGEVVRREAEGFKQGLAQANEQLVELGAGLKAQGENAQLSAQALLSHAETLQQAGRAAAASIEGMGKILEDQRAALERTGQDSDQVLSDAAQAVRRESSALSGAADRLIESSTAFADSVSGQTRALDQAGERMDSRVGQLAAALGDRVADLTRLSSETGRLAGSLQATLQAATAGVDTATATALQKAAEAAAALKQGSDSIEAVVGGAAQHLDHVLNGAGQKMEGLEAAVERISGGLHAVGDTALKETGELQTAAQRVAERLQHVGEVARQQVTSMGESAERTALQTRQTGEFARQQTQELQAIAGELGDALDGLGEILLRRIKNLKETGEEARTEADALGEAAERAGRDLQGTGESARRELAEIRKSAGSAAAEIVALRDAAQKQMESLNQLSARLAVQAATIGETLQGRAALLEQAANVAAHRTGEIGDALDHHADSIARNAEKAAVRMESLRSAMSGGADAVQRASGEAVSSLTSANELLRRTAGEVSTAAGSARAAAEGTVEALRDAARGLEEAGSSVAERAEIAAARFTDTQRSLAERSDAAVEALYTVNSELDQHIHTLSEMATRALENAKQTADALLERAGEIEAASDRAGERTEELRQAARELSSGEFLRTAAFVTESLNDISIDLARVLDRDLTEDLWRRYYKGERGLFARRLLDKRDVAAIRKNYDADPEFRRFVDKYLKGFGDLLAQSRAAEHEELLSSAFISSDIGKVYLLLWEAVGKGTGRNQEN